MKLTTLAITATTAASLALAQPHKHQHGHAHAKKSVTVSSVVAGPTVYAYVLDNQTIDLDEVCQGLEGKTLEFAGGEGPSGLCDSTSSTSTVAPVTTTTTTTTTQHTTKAVTTTTTTTVAPTTTTTTTTSLSAVNTAAQFYQKSNTFSYASSAWASPAASSPASSAASSAASASSSSSSSSGTTASGSGVSSDFPDGQLDCSTFPSSYGAVSLSYLGMGGWSGLQAVTVSGSTISNIVTGVSGQSCTEGMMCSYACPPGYQKSQWPSTQGSTGQSVGGISCSGGKLHLTNSALSTKLCIPGVGGVQATNKASGVVAICRTDYPGTESETIPVELAAGSTQPLAVPDAATYYSWQGASTSAQYYLNPIGTSAQDGCQWGSAGSNIGNYAPINLGVGYKDGKTWLSIFQNSPTTTTQYSGTVELQGNLSGTCKYSNGQYCGATGCNAQGCTVAVLSGTATYVVSN